MGVHRLKRIRINGVDGSRAVLFESRCRGSFFALRGAALAINHSGPGYTVTGRVRFFCLWCWFNVFASSTYSVSGCSLGGEKVLFLRRDEFGSEKW